MERAPRIIRAVDKGMVYYDTRDEQVRENKIGNEELPPVIKVLPLFLTPSDSNSYLVLTKCRSATLYLIMFLHCLISVNVLFMEHYA